MKRFAPVRLARMHAALRRHVESGQIPGLVALVHHRGREYVETIGTMGFDSNVPVRRDTIFRLASTTKPITAVGAMILVEECKVRLDDPVDEWLPELKDRRVLRTIESPLDDTLPAKRPITLRDLLTFRSGYGEVAFLSPTCPLQKALAEARLPLSESPFAGTPDEFLKRFEQYATEVTGPFADRAEARCRSGNTTGVGLPAPTARRSSACPRTPSARTSSPPR